MLCTLGLLKRDALTLLPLRLQLRGCHTAAAAAAPADRQLSS